jgi:hypothetical protein
MNRERLNAVFRLLVDSGDMTPMAVRQINAVLDAESPPTEDASNDSEEDEEDA